MAKATETVVYQGPVKDSPAAPSSVSLVSSLVTQETSGRGAAHALPWCQETASKSMEPKDKNRTNIVTYQYQETRVLHGRNVSGYFVRLFQNVSSSGKKKNTLPREIPTLTVCKDASSNHISHGSFSFLFSISTAQEIAFHLYYMHSYYHLFIF